MALHLTITSPPRRGRAVPDWLDPPLAQTARKAALAQVAHGRALQRSALLHVQRQLHAGRSLQQARAVIQQELDDHAHELQLIAEQLIANEQDPELAKRMVDDLLADAKEGGCHA